MNKQQQIALCGLGNMGLAIAKRLALTYPVVGFDLSQERRQIADSIDSVRTVADLESFRGMQTVVLSLPTPAASRTVCERLAEILPTGALVVETSTTTPRDVQHCERILAQAGVRLIDAAILSGVGQMESGVATLLVGGSDDDVQSAAPVLRAFSRQQEVFGPLGAGSAAKVVNNGVAHAVMVVLIEALTMSAACGVDLGKITDMLATADGGLVRPLTHRVMERIAAAEFSGGMPMEAARKDSTLALDLAQQHCVPLFAIQGAHTAYELAISAGTERLDYSALATLWEQWTGQRLAYRSEVAL